MPTESNKNVLERDFAKALAREIIDVKSPLLKELVNHATHALRRCELGVKDRVDVVPLILYLHIIELVDGIDVLDLSPENCTSYNLASD